MPPSTPRIVLHIGAMKTGTTYLQHLLLANPEGLAAQGADFVGDRWSEQVRATQDLLEMADPQIAAEADGAWDRIVARMLGFDGAVSILSMEFLSFASAEHAARAVASFGEAEVDIVLTVRDAAAVVPAQWQTAMSSGEVEDWATFQRGVRRSAGLVGKAVGRLTNDRAREVFRQAQGIRRMLRTWGSLVPPERFHVVTVPRPPAPKTALWERFCVAAGLDPAPCTQEPKRSNPSIGYASSELVRRINAELALELQSDYNKTVKDHLVDRVLVKRRDEEDRARLDEETHDFALRWNARVRDAITASGVHVVGDLDDLPVRPDGRVVPVAHQPPPTDAELLAAAGTAYPGMQKVVRRRAGRVGVTEADLAAETSGLVGPDGWAAQPDPVAAAVADVAQLCRIAVRLRRLHRGFGTDDLDD